MARFDRCQLLAALESGVALLVGATSPPFCGGKQRSLSPRLQPSRYTHRRIVDTALQSEAPSAPKVRAHRIGLRDLSDRSFKVLALRALESVEVVAGALWLNSN
jgi:hypothetical protein